MNKIFLFLVMGYCFLAFGSLTAQEYVFTAKTFDENDIPLGYCIVEVSSPSGSKRLSTNNNGVVQFTLEKKQPYKVTVTRSYRIPVTYSISSNEDIVKRFVMLPQDSYDLDSLVIQADNSIRYKKDTTFYKLEAFSNKSERRLKDILKKLPGVEYNNGVVKLNGKMVSKITVENKDFFGNNQTIALEKLPASALETAEFIRNANESSILDGTRNNSLVLNLKLKNKKKNILFGDLNIGLGIEKRFENSGNLFYFGNTSVNLITNSNNTAKPSLTFKDLIAINSDMSQITKLDFDKVISNIYEGPLAQFMNTENDLERKENFVGLNINHRFNEKLNLDAFVMANDIDLIKEQQNSINYLDPNSVFANENRRTRSDLDQANAITKIKSSYKRNSNSEIFANLLINYNSSKPKTSILQEGNELSNLDIQSQSTNLQIRTNWEWHQRYALRHRGFYAIDLNHEDNNLSTAYKSDNNVFPNQITFDSEEEFRLLQEQSPISNSGTFSYKHIYDHTARKVWTLDLEGYREKHALKNRLEELTQDMNRTIFQSDSEFIRSKVTTSITYSYYVERLIFDFGMKYRHMATIQKSQENTINITENFITPYFKFTFDFRNSEQFTLKYDFKPVPPRFLAYLNEPVLASFNRIRIGNQNLLNERFHEVNAHYHKNLKYYKLNLNNNFKLQMAEQGLVRFVLQEGLTTTETLALFENPNLSWSNNLSVSKGLFTLLNISYSNRLNSQKSKRFFNDDLVQNKSFRVANEMKLQLKPDKRITFSYAISHDYNRFKSNEINNTVIDWRHSLNLDWQFLKYFNLKSDFKITQQNDVFNRDNSFYDMDVLLAYFHQEKALNVTFKIQNAFNNTRRINNTLEQQILSRNEVFIQPRFYLLSVGWNF